MKEAYFTNDSLPATAKRMLGSVTLRDPSRRPLFQPELTALLVIDMQDYFLHPDSLAFLPSGPAIVPGVQSLISACAAAQRPIIFTRHLDLPETDTAMWRWWQRRLLSDDPLSRLTRTLNASGALVLEKNAYDAFLRTDLEATLRSRSVTQVLVCGVMTNLCCETTARSAFVRGFDVFIPIDATATMTYELHLATIRNLAHGFAEIDTTQSFLSRLQEPDGA